MNILVINSLVFAYLEKKQNYTISAEGVGNIVKYCQSKMIDDVFYGPKPVECFIERYFTEHDFDEMFNSPEPPEYYGFRDLVGDFINTVFDDILSNNNISPANDLDG